MSTDPTAHRDDDLLRRIRGEYVEMPGLSLTDRQAQRFWSLDAQTCRQLLDTLVEAGFLRRTAGDCFVRRSDGAPVAPLLRMARSAAPEETPASRALSQKRAAG